MLFSHENARLVPQAKRVKVMFDVMEMGTFEATSLIAERPTGLVVGAEVRIRGVMASFNVTTVDATAGT
eukprot:1921487-Prymnesium_polylepis.1